MTIASQLSAVNAAKLAIKASIEAKGQTVGSAPLSAYASKIDAITGGGSTGPINTPDTWVRPSDWLAMPTLTSSEQKIAILCAVYPTGSSVSFNILGAYTVDWGDGTSPQNFASGVTATYNYDYASISSSTNTTRGFRQAIITITPQSGQSLFNVNLSQGAPTGSNTTVIPRSVYLDLNMQVGAPNGSTDTTVIVSQSSANTGTTATSLEHARIAVVSGSADFFLANAFNACTSLRKVEIDTGSRRTFVQGMFNGCRQLESAPMFNLNSGTSCMNMFASCNALVDVPLYNTSAVTNFSGMFTGCRSLQVVPQFDTSLATDVSSMFTSCQRVASFPDFVTSNVTNFTSMFNGCNFVQAPNLNTSKGTNFTSMFSSCNAMLIAPAYDLSKATNTTSMFNACVALETVPTYTLTALVTATSMFASCVTLRSVPDMTVPRLQYANSMFSGCSGLDYAPNMTVNSNSMQDCSSMFSGCVAMMYVPAYAFPSPTTAANMFSGCSSLVEIPAINIASSTNTTNGVSSMIDTCNNLRRFSAVGLRHTVNFTTTQLSATELETVILNLANGNGTTYTMAMGSAPGAILNPLISKATSGIVNNSTAVTVINNTGLVVGMQAVGVGLVSSTVTTDTATKLITRTAHGFSNGDEVAFSAITTTTGINLRQIYFVVNSSADTFQIAVTPGGAAVAFVSSGSGTLQYRNVITAINSSTSITVKYPSSATTASLTLSFRALNTQRGTMKGWSITG